MDPFGLAAGGGAYLFEMTAAKDNLGLPGAYAGKGDWVRYYEQSTVQRLAPNGIVDRGVWMDTKSPCKSISEAEYGEMVEHKVMELYPNSNYMPNFLTLVNNRASPGKNRIDPTVAKGKQNLKKCPGVDGSAKNDAIKLINALKNKPKGAGK